MRKIKRVSILKETDLESVIDTEKVYTIVAQMAETGLNFEEAIQKMDSYYHLEIDQEEWSKVIEYLRQNPKLLI